MKDEVNGVGITKKQYETNKKYNDKTYEQLGFRSRKDERLDELIALGAEKTGQTKSMYMKGAIQSQLTRDGITIDMLPVNSKYIPPAPEPKQPRRYMIYIITERFSLDDNDAPEKYIAMFPTLKAAEKYAKAKFERKPYPADWTYTIYGRYMEGDNQRDAWDKLKVIVKNELEIDRENGGKDDDGLYWLDRIERDYPADCTGKIECDDDNAKSEFDDLEFFDFDLIDDEENDEDEDE